MRLSCVIAERGADDRIEDAFLPGREGCSVSGSFRELTRQPAWPVVLHREGTIGNGGNTVARQRDHCYSCVQTCTIELMVTE